MNQDTKINVRQPAVPTAQLHPEYQSKGDQNLLPSSASVSPGSMRIQLFGSFCVFINGRAIKRMGSKTGNRLFAYLALYHRLSGCSPAERSDLATMLWPETSHTAAMETLRHCISDMRAALGEEAYRLVSPSRNSLALDIGGVDIDTELFEQLAAGGSLEQIRQAIELSAAPLLNDMFDDWAVHERNRFQAMHLELLERLAAQSIAEHQPNVAIEPLKRAFEANTLDETVARALMSSYAAIGDFDGALKVYGRLRTRLRTVHSAPPDPATSTLAAEIRKTQRDEHKAAPFEMAATATRRQAEQIGRLPLQPGPLIGRDNAILEVRAAVESHRLVTLIGSGGIGKTQLAISAARSAWGEFPDGVWFVDLSSRTDASANSSLLAGEILSVMGERPTGGRPDDSLCSLLGSKSLLLVLDNCEQVTNACRDLVGTIVETCPRVHLLATSRRPLQPGLEKQIKVSSLTVPRARSATINSQAPVAFRPEQWTKYSAIALFQDRAMLARRSFELNANNAPGVAAICRLLEGIPLAIELVAPWVRSLTVQQIGRQLISAISLFTNTDRGVQQRHSTLLATVAWSYDLLNGAERRLWRYVSLFTDGFTLAAAQQICAPELSEQEIIQLVTGLIDSSVLAYSEQDGVGRYSLPETMRAFGMSRIDTDTASSNWDEVRLRYLAYFLAYAEEAAPHLRSAQQAEWVKLLHAERANLRTACDIGGAQHRPNDAMRLGSAAWRMFYIRGEHSEGFELLKAALSAPGDADPALRACALADAGNLLYQMHRYEDAGRYYEEALDLFRHISDKAGIARALGNLSLISTANRDYERSRELLEECRVIFVEIGNRQGEAAAIGNLAVNAAAQGDYVGALKYHEESTIFFREFGDLHRVVLALANIVSIQHHLEKYEALLPLLRECLEISRELENAGVLLQALLTVMLTARRLARYKEGATLAGAHFSMRVEFQLPLGKEEEVEQNAIVETIIENIGRDEYEMRARAGAALSHGEIVDCALRILN